MATTYERFLASSDPAVWAACLDDCERALADRAVAEVVTQALCISGYARWLGRMSGDSSRREHASRAFARLVDTLTKLDAGAESAATKRGWGVALAFAGYHRAAKTSFEVSGGLTSDLAVLIAPSDHAERAALLRPFVSESAAHVFPPALYFYCGALINLGAIQEATRLLDDAVQHAPSPMMWELIGVIHERAGQWAEALEAYRHSTWPDHRFRAEVCRAISAQGGGSAGGRTASPPGDETLREALSRFETEIDQAEIARSTAFVNACLGDTDDHWLVRFELGKLSFRKRRYVEADAQLTRALALAPETCRFPIAHLRFTNLTWLTGRSLSHDLPMDVETLEAAHAALAAGPRDDEAAPIRVWLAQATRDISLLPRDVESWDPYEQAMAHELVGNTPEALRNRLQVMQRSFGHRNLLSLFTTCSEGRFETSADYLLDSIIGESWTDFFSLWELAKSLDDARERFSESSAGFNRLNTRLDTIAGRLIALSQFEFQHLIRAHELFSRLTRRDAAEEVLRRAGDLAEGAGENLAVAVARRATDEFQIGRGDAKGLECLLRAERESGDRLERLQIARELFHYGRAYQARCLLAAEGVFTAGASLEPVEYIAALQCKEWLKPEEYAALVRRALGALAAGLATSAISRYGDRYFARIRSVAGPGDASLPVHDFSDEGRGDTGAAAESAGLPVGEWAAWHTSMRSAVEASDGERERAIFLDGASRLAGDSSTFPTKLATWAWVSQQLESALEAAAKVRPVRPAGEIPISENLTLDDDVRAVELSDLWRRHLSSTRAEPNEPTRRRLDTFFETERRLRSEWDAAWRSAASPHLERALFYARFAVEFLPTIVSISERSERHPMLRGLYECAARDCDALVRRIGDDIAVIQRMRHVEEPLEASGSP